MADSTTKSKILQTMYTLVSEKGYDKTSIGQIAESIGIQKPSVYYYFKSKEDIFMALVQVLYQTDYATKSKLLHTEISAAAYQDALVATGEDFIDSYFEHQTLRKVYAEIDIQTTRIPALKDFIAGSDKQFHLFMQTCLERGIAVGAFPPDFDAVLNAQILYTLLVGIDQAILYELPINPKAVWRESVSKLFHERNFHDRKTIHRPTGSADIC